MSAVERHAGMSHRPHTAARSASRGHTLPGPRADAAAAFSDAAAAAMQVLAARQNGQPTAVKAASAPVAAAGPVAGAAAASADSRAVAAAYSRFIGRSAGSGQCVALVYAATPGIGSTACWTGGAAVRGNTSLQPGTVIATFDKCGRYANATDGSSHAAIYLGQNEQGIQVLDQWSGSPAAVRTIRWTNPGATPANTGTAFRVVQTS